MEVKTTLLSDKQVADCLGMFAMDEWEKCGMCMVSTESIGEDGMTLRDYIKNVSNGDLEDEEVQELVEFGEAFDTNWLVFVVSDIMQGGNDKLCGLIAFKDWQG
jgi:hypothetical protein